MDPIPGTSVILEHGANIAPDDIKRMLTSISRGNPDEPKENDDSGDDCNGFIPRNRLISVFNYNNALQCLSACLSSSVETTKIDLIARDISPEDGECPRCSVATCTGLRIIFVTLLLLNRGACILEIHKSGEKICDSTWPLDNPSNECPTALALRNITQSFEVPDKELFISLQWRMRSPYFKTTTQVSQGVKPFEVRDEVILPWIKAVKIVGSERGNLSSVYKIKIHAGHHDDHTSNGGWFAVKILEKGKVLAYAEDVFKRETAANQRATHPRIVPLLAAFKHRNKFHLLFPLASGGDLQQFWEKFGPRPDLGGEPAPWFSPEWVTEQCYNIADALATVHGYSSNGDAVVNRPQIHHDIKPENILCFDDSRNGEVTYNLMLTDFGLSLLADSRSTFRPEDITATLTYRPPEVDIPDGSDLGQKMDVWCLGCLYLDFVTWAILGWSGVEDFEDKRTERDETESGGSIWIEDTFFAKRKVAQYGWCFRKTFRKEANIKPSVISHMDDLRRHEICRGNMKLGKILDYIERKMLVVNTKKRDESSKKFHHVT
ncbi:kinase-like domain-containing protein [Colletotrichum phormii]|uniref:Kinase-like domain-containing protein n=1 Tax=Colletotrichum phormii TaxID=359342 RepID=A0AAJ0E8C7_9PEZI|nr:kinase-like domain-containing protein [Colletotrichum phormii]KAK1621525.1 kinase-like domain-containing protein [Colletotrichum phormii]